MRVHPAAFFFGTIDPVIALNHRWPWSRIAAPPDSATFPARRILLASEGRPFSPAAIGFTARLAQNAGGAVHLLAIARIWGSSFGLPHPGLMPTRREWQAQHDAVAAALDALKRLGIEGTGQVLSSRNAGKRILKEATLRGSDAIVMGADGPRHWLVSDMIWSQEPYRIRRLASLPVYLVEETSTKPRR